MAFKRTKYRAPDPSKLKERGSRSSNRYDSIFIEGVTPFKPAGGTNILRIVKDPDADYYGEPIWVHSYVGIKNSTYLCPKKMGKSKHCPICDMADEAARAGDKDERYALEAKERVIAYIIDRQDEKAGLKVWDMSWTMDRDVADACVIKKTGKIIDITHPDAGYDLSFQRQGTAKNNTKYFGLQVDRESTPLSDNQRQADAWLDEAQERPLLSLLKYKDAEYLADILSGKVEEKDEDEGDSTTEREDTRPARGRSAARNEPVDREDYRDDNGEDEQDEAPPPRRGSRDAEDRGQEREVRGSSRRASASEPDDAPEEEDGARVARRTRDRSAPASEREPPPRTSTRVGRGTPDDEPDDIDDRPPPRRTPRPAATDERQGGETAEAERWARGSRRGVEDSRDPVDADDDPGERAGRRQRLQEPEKAEEQDDLPPRRGARNVDREPPPRERAARERAVERGRDEAERVTRGARR